MVAAGAGQEDPSPTPPVGSQQGQTRTGETQLCTPSLSWRLTCPFGPVVLLQTYPPRKSGREDKTRGAESNAVSCSPPPRIGYKYENKENHKGQT